VKTKAIHRGAYPQLNFGGIFVTAANKFVYKVELATAADIFNFVRIAAQCPYDVEVINGRHRLNAKSYMGVMLAKASWEEVYVCADNDCYFEFEQYIR
jgi:hypothetical protein